MAEEVLGSGISKGVADQLFLREKLIGERNKSKEHLLFFNSNGAWVRLVSSVNTLTEKEAVDYRKEGEKFKEANTTEEELQPQNGGSSILASANVLFGGMYPQGTTPGVGGLLEGRHTPLNIDSKGHITPSVPKQGDYHNYESLGYRPVPGIQSATVQSKNTYGTLREAEVKVVVWTLEDLEVMQALYLRPGYSILMEWGHSLGLDDQKNIIQDISTYRGFLEGKKGQNDIEQALLKNRKDSDYNYDAMYGYISNFSWSFRPDGGYDCTVKIISKGAILESLALAFDTTKRYKPGSVNPDNDEQSKIERRSIFHKFRVEVEKVVNDKEGIPAQGYTLPNQISDKYGRVRDDRDNYSVKTIVNSDLGDTGEAFKDKLNLFRAYPLPVKKEVVEADGDTDTIKGSSIYIPMRVLLDIYNNFCTLDDSSSTEQVGRKAQGYGYTQFYTGWQDERNAKGSTDPGNYTNIFKKEAKFLTTKYHFSIDPKICIIPGQLEEERNLKFYNKDCNLIKDPAIGGKGEFSVRKAYHNLGSIQIGNFDLAVTEYIEEEGEKDDILNILISLDHVTSIVDSLLKSEKSTDQNTSNNMTVFMQRLLEDINNSLGGVNDLDVSYDEDENLFYVVDRRLTPKDLNTLPKLTFAGLNSTITELNISSKISSNIASQISISAQAGNTGTKDNIGPLLQWNKGLVDRHLVVKGTKDKKDTEPDKDENKPEKSRLEKWLEEYSEIWHIFKIYKRSTDFIKWLINQDKYAKLVDSNLYSLAEYHKEYCQKYVTEYYFKSKKGLPPPGNIPVELSFKTIGIAGLKIGQAFGLQRGVLPQSYTDDYGFIITGLSHDISGNKWTTEVKALFFCAKPPPEHILTQYKKEIGLECTLPTPPVETPTPTSEDTEDLGTSPEWWTLVAISYAENFPGKLQGYADVAQSLYNRAAARYFGGSIIKNINAPGQYEPVFNNKQDWANIQDIDTAAVAVRNYKSHGETARGRTLPSSYTVDFYKQELKKCSDALQNPQLKQEAARFVGSRTEFLAYNPTSALAVGVVERQPATQNNAFYWRYEGKDLFYNQGKLAATDFNRVTPPDNAVV